MCYACNQIKGDHEKMSVKKLRKRIKVVKKEKEIKERKKVICSTCGREKGKKCDRAVHKAWLEKMKSVSVGPGARPSRMEGRTEPPPKRMTKR